MAWACLVESIDKNTRSKFRETTTAREVLELTEKLYGMKDQAKYLQIVDRLNSLKYIGNGLDDHLNIVRGS